MRIRYLKHNIIAINEVKLKNPKYLVITTEFPLEGYKIFSQNTENQEGRGIIINIENSLPAEKVNLNTSFKECIFVKLKLIINKRKLLFGCIYRSDAGSDENNEELIHMIKTTSQLNYSHIITVGDFNLPGIYWKILTTKSNNPSNLNFIFVECLRDSFMSQHVTDPTRGRGSNNPNVLDLILSNDEDIIGDVESISPLGRSDHCILTCEILCIAKLNNYTKRRKHYKNADFDRTRIEFSKIDWKTKFKDSDTNVNR